MACHTRGAQSTHKAHTKPYMHIYTYVYRAVMNAGDASKRQHAPYWLLFHVFQYSVARWFHTIWVLLHNCRSRDRPLGKEITNCDIWNHIAATTQILNPLRSLSSTLHRRQWSFATIDAVGSEIFSAKHTHKIMQIIVRMCLVRNSIANLCTIIIHFNVCRCEEVIGLF